MVRIGGLGDQDALRQEALLGVARGGGSRFFERKLPPGATHLKEPALCRALRDAAENENDDERENSADGADLGEKVLWHCVMNVVEALRGETIPMRAVVVPVSPLCTP